LGRRRRDSIKHVTTRHRKNKDRVLEKDRETIKTTLAWNVIGGKDQQSEEIKKRNQSKKKILPGKKSKQ